MSEPRQAPQINPDLRILQPGRAVPGLLPGATPVKPGMILPSSSIVKFASWCYIDRQNPNSNLGLNAATIYASSDTNLSEDGTTAAKKMLFNFEKPVNFTPSQKVLVYFGANTASAASLTFSGGTFVATTPSFDLKMAVRRITASFVTANQTWNNYGSLTQALENSVLLDKVSFPSGWVRGASLSIGGSTVPLSYSPQTSGIYGFVVDVMPEFLNYDSVTWSAISASVQADLLTTAKPYLVISG